VSEFIRLLQNPYAKLSLLDDDQEVAAVTVSDPKRIYFKKLQNPCAYDSIFGEQEDLQLPLIEESNRLASKHGNQHGISKKEFGDNCRRIFRQYIPPDEGRMLRTHYRDFITRNENSPGDHRFKLLKELSKYDLALDGNFKPHFNRESELLTSYKLYEIEKAAKNS
jgi:hypothetical protein